MNQSSIGSVKQDIRNQNFCLYKRKVCNITLVFVLLMQALLFGAWIDWSIA